jgi:hypothetical protein
MHFDRLSLALRPRPMYEAADLGVRLAQAHAGSAWRCYAPLWGAVTLIALATAPIASWLPWTLLFLAKPWLDRSLLFVFSRAVFGQATTWRDLWQAKRSVWLQDLLSTLTLRRLSGTRSYTQPVWQLEGLRGKARRARVALMLKGQRGPAVWTQLVFAHLEGVLMLALYVLAEWMYPGSGSVMHWINDLPAGTGTLLSSAAYALVVLVLEPYYVAAGFAMYLNRRVELEAWDVEREMRSAFAA